MLKADFQKLIGVDGQEAEYVPVACLLRSGYGCAGYYNEQLNRDLIHACVLVNARLVEFHSRNGGGHCAAIDNFSEFLEEIVTRVYRNESGDAAEQIPADEARDLYGKSIPLTAIDFDEITLLYPVSHISALMRRAEPGPNASVPSFLDFNHKSEIIKLLRTRLW